MPRYLVDIEHRVVTKHLIDAEDVGAALAAARRIVDDYSPGDFGGPAEENWTITNITTGESVWGLGTETPPPSAEMCERVFRCQQEDTHGDNGCGEPGGHAA